jgi:pyruvate/2-oxoglutarate dehydrogenase complex dihydrolipoamide acyltransferase (E2) component
MKKTIKLFLNNNNNSILISPSTKLLLLEYPNIKVKDVKATGKFGRIITKQDFFNYLKNLKEPNNQENKGDTKTSLNNITFKDKYNSEDYIIFTQKFMKDKKNIPQNFITINCNVNGILKLKEERKFELRDFFISIASKTLKKVSECNFIQNNEYLKQEDINITVPIKLKNGSPFYLVLKNADGLNIDEISNLLKNKEKEEKINEQNINSSLWYH